MPRARFSTQLPACRPTRGRSGNRFSHTCASFALRDVVGRGLCLFTRVGHSHTDPGRLQHRRIIVAVADGHHLRHRDRIGLGNGGKGHLFAQPRRVTSIKRGFDRAI